MASKKALQPKEFQIAVIHALEAIQSEIGLVIEGLKFAQDDKAALRPRIVLPMVGKQCFIKDRVVLPGDLAKSRSRTVGVAAPARRAARKDGE